MSLTVTLTIRAFVAPHLTGFSVSPASIQGSKNSTGLVTFDLPCPSTGSTVNLTSSNPLVAAVPTSVTVPTFTTTTTFPITTGLVAVDTPVTLTTKFNGWSLTTVLTVLAPTQLTLRLSPAVLKGGQTSTGTVYLPAPAPDGGSVVSVSSSNPGAVPVLDTVTVPAGSTTAAFSIPSVPVAEYTTVTITAAFNGQTDTAVLTVQPPTLRSLTLNPTTIQGHQSSIGTVSLDTPAPSGGTVVRVTCNNLSAATVEGMVTVSAGNTTASFTIISSAVSQDTVVMLTATLSRVNQTATLTVLAPQLTSLTLNPTSLKGGQSALGTVTLNSPAPANGTTIALVSNSTAAAVPDIVVVPEGATTATFPVTTSPVLQDTPVILTGTLNGQMQTAALTVQAPTLLSLTLNPTSVIGASTSTATLTLDAPAPSGGVVARLTNPMPTLLTMPANLTIPAGATSANFTLKVGKRTAPITLTLTAATNYGSKTADLTVIPRLPFDFNDDGYNDLLFQNTQSGQIVSWYMNGQNVLGGTSLPTIPAAGWNVVGAADFNADGRPDLIFQNATSGKVLLWYMNGTNLLGGEPISIVPTATYKVVATGDFNDDGNVDLVFQNQNTREIVIWYMQGANVIGGAALPFIPAAGLSMVGAGDFNGDGHPDLVFQNTATGQLTVWYMSGSYFFGTGLVSTKVPSGWQVKGVADYNGDGMTDIVLQNKTDNRLIVWFMSGIALVNPVYTSVPPSAPYQVVGPH